MPGKSLITKKKKKKKEQTIFDMFNTKEIMMKMLKRNKLQKQALDKTD